MREWLNYRGFREQVLECIKVKNIDTLAGGKKYVYDNNSNNVSYKIDSNILYINNSEGKEH